MSSQYYDLRKSDDVDKALRELQGFWKLWSGCLLTDCGLPTLSGFILNQSQCAISLFHQLGPTTVLVRHDKYPESPPYPRGGFLVGYELLEETIQFFFSLGRIVAIYEPADPLLNMHNMNLLFESNREVSVEVVGPGFDASDLQRGDLSPHETYSVRLTRDGDVSEINLLQRVDDAAYQQSVVERKTKIKNKLETAPSVDLARRIRKSLEIPEDLDSHLRNIDSPLLKYQAYPPVSQNLLRDTVIRIVKSKVISQYKTLTGARYPLVFSTSLVNGGKKQVFWDIVSPALKFQGLLNQRV